MMTKTMKTANFIIKDRDDIVKKIHSLTEADTKMVMSTFGMTGTALLNAMNSFTPCGTALFNIINRTASAVPGSRIVGLIKSLNYQTNLLTHVGHNRQRNLRGVWPWLGRWSMAPVLS